MKHPHADGTVHIDNGRLESLIAAYQTGTDRATALSEIVTLTDKRALTLYAQLRPAVVASWSTRPRTERASTTSRTSRCANDVDRSSRAV